jgi:hypothetical protein
MMRPMRCPIALTSDAMQLGFSAASGAIGGVADIFECTVPTEWEVAFEASPAVSMFTKAAPMFAKAASMRVVIAAVRAEAALMSISEASSSSPSVNCARAFWRFSSKIYFSRFRTSFSPINARSLSLHL